MKFFKIEPYPQSTYSGKTLRQAVGWIGIFLPFTLMLGAWLLFCGDWKQDSISHFYHTGMVDVFVGALCAVGLFMLFYKGYDIRDNLAGLVAGFSAIGVAWFPTTAAGETDGVGTVHYVCATVLFATFATFCLWLFRMSDTNKKDRKNGKNYRNMVYLLCGFAIVGCMVAIGLYHYTHDDNDPVTLFVFIMETIALVAFGISWLTKGKPRILGYKGNAPV